jgi:signal transduction histidine kinase
MWSAGAGLAVSVAILAIFHRTMLPLIFTLLLVAYFVLLSGYVVYAVVRAARHSSGVTRRRMRAVAFGTACLGIDILLAGVQSAFPHAPAWIWSGISAALGLGCGVSYFVGFTPPEWLRRAWQEPDLRGFLSRAAALPRLPDTAAIVREMERGAAGSLGTSHAVIGLWNPSAGDLEFLTTGQTDLPLIDTAARRAFETRTSVFCADARREYPDDAAVYHAYGVNSIVSVPIVAGSEVLGVLSVYGARAPIFAEDDLKLAQLLADQAAVILESRALIDEAARVRAREEATRLKDDFLSAAAHDLKTPLTALIVQAQLLERRVRRDPTAPADATGIARILQDAQRLRYLVTELLDVSRVEQGKLLDKREELDLVTLVRGACERLTSPLHTCRLEAREPVMGSYDGVRIVQLVDNLLENAVKYSPAGGPIDVRVWRDGEVAHLTVTDTGIGIPREDLDELFDRFQRGTNVDDRRFAGMGLGLFICRGIAEQHGGRIWATSPGPGKGSTFHVELPARVPAPVEQVTEPTTGSVVLAPGESQ